MKNFFKVFRVLDDGFKMKSWLIAAVAIGWWIYEVAGMMEDVTSMIFTFVFCTPLVILALVFAPFALLPLQGIMNMVNSFLSGWVFFGPMIIIVYVIKLFLWLIGAMVSLIFSPLTGPVIAWFYYIKDVR